MDKREHTLKTVNDRQLGFFIRVWLLIGLIALVNLPLTVRAQQNNPATALFNFQCGSGEITFFLDGTAVIQASFAQIAGPLTVAVASQQNQRVASGNEVSLWALKSDELQVHLDSDPDGTKLVVSSGVCGAVLSSSAGSNEAVVVAQATGTGEVIAVAEATSNGQVTAYAQVTGTGYAIAYARSNRGEAHIHIVQPGETLFRIAIRYHTTVSVLIAMNGIDNPRVIFAGQSLYIP
jgi:LysM repeat protein